MNDTDKYFIEAVEDGPLGPFSGDTCYYDRENEYNDPDTNVPWDECEAYPYTYEEVFQVLEDAEKSKDLYGVRGLRVITQSQLPKNVNVIEF